MSAKLFRMIEDLETKIEGLEKELHDRTLRLETLERVWDRYRRRLGSPKWLDKPRWKSRAKVLRDVGILQDPTKVKTNGGIAADSR